MEVRDDEIEGRATVGRSTGEVPGDRPGALRRRLVSGGLWVTAARLSGIFGTVAANVLLAKLLVPADFGGFGLVTNVVNFAALWAMLGLNYANVRFVSEGLGLGDPGRVRRTLALGLGLGAASTAVVAVVLLAIPAHLALRLGIPRPGSVVPLAVALLALTSIQHLIAATLRGFHELRFASWLGGQQPSGSPPLIVLFVVLMAAVAPFTRPTLELALGVFGLATAIALPAGLACLRSTARAGLAEAGARGGARLSEIGAGTLLAVGLPLMLSQVLAFTTRQSDLWIAGATVAPERLALYVAARRIMMMVGVPLTLVNQSVISSIPELWSQGRTAELQRMLRGGATLAGIPSFVALVGLILVPGPILVAFFGPFYRDAAVPLLVLALGQFLLTWVGACELTLMMTGHERVALMVNLPTAAIMLLVGPPSARAFGLVGLASASSLVIAAQGVALWLLARKLVGVWTHARPPWALAGGLGALRRR